MKKMYDELDREIVIGSLVRLASDGPDTTVVEVRIAGEPIFKDPSLACHGTWAESTIRVAFFEHLGQFRAETFPVAALRVLNRSGGEFRLLSIRVVEEDEASKHVDEQREQFLADRATLAEPDAAMAAIDAIHDEEVADRIESEEDHTAGWDGPNR